MEPMALADAIRRTVVEAIGRSAVPSPKLYGAPSVTMDPYDYPAEVVPEELGNFEVELLVPGANDPATDPFEDVLERPLRGTVLADDEM